MNNTVRRYATFLPAAILPLLFVAAAWRYSPLLEKAKEARPLPFDYFETTLLPFAAAHVVVALIAWFASRRRAGGPLAVWAVTAAALLAFASWRAASAVALMTIFGAICTLIGALISRFFCGAPRRTWGIDAAIGVAGVSFAAAALATVHALTTWSLAAVLLLIAATELLLRLRSRRGDRSERARLDLSLVRERMRAAAARTLSFSSLLSIETGVLLTIASIVWAAFPETSSDATRVYLPYLKILEVNRGFVDLPVWSYAIPQAGITFMSAVHLLFGSVTARSAMLFTVFVLVAILVRLSDRAPALPLAVLVASTPMLLRIGSSSRLDAFAFLMMVAVGAVALKMTGEEKPPHWLLLGFLVGTAWSAKFSALVYCIFFIGYALFRAARRGGAIRFAVAFASLLGGALTAALPWLVQSARVTGNPVYPFLRSLFPTRWPAGAVAGGNLAAFRLPAGPLAWLEAPLSFTFETSRFVEGYDGVVGLTLLILLALALVGLARPNRTSIIFALSAVAGSLALWSHTAYVRYWIVALWLLVPLASDGLALLYRARVARLVAPLIVCLTVVLHFPVAMIHLWRSPTGFPWGYFTGSESYAQFLELWPGEQTVHDLREADPDWPLVWFTGNVPSACYRAQAIEAHPRFITAFGGGTPEGMIRFLESVGADYWIVDANFVPFFRERGISEHFLRDDHIVTSDGPVTVYRMPGSLRGERAARKLAGRPGRS